jgi:superfamily II DNA or RNA helicase
MSLTLAITPSGDLQIVSDPESLPTLSEQGAARLNERFGHSNGAGLLLLASQELAEELPPTLVFWRSFARQLMLSLCRLGEDGFAKWKTVPPPGEDVLAQWIADAPPMRGLEYLTADALCLLWCEVRDHVAACAAASSDGPVGFLREVNPLWHLLGRVTFHLAENKRDSNRPFAFLATFTHRLSSQARLQHLPLAEALKRYAGARDKAKLDVLLEPVRRAAQASDLARELLESKALFSPQAWSIRQAHRFLTEAPRLEAAGVVVRVPDWWSVRKPPRPQVDVRIGGRPASSLGIDQLLDFEVALSLDGQRLSEAECREILTNMDGLVLLKGKWVEVDQERLAQALDHWKELQRQHAEGIDFVEGMRLLAGVRLQDEGAADDRVASWSRVEAGDWLRETLARLRHPREADSCEPGRDLAATLRPYQQEGVRWLWFMTEMRLGACLADDMGLGKTIQVIDLLLQRKRLSRRQAKGPALLVVPASLMGNWRQELARFAPQSRTFFAHRAECGMEELDRVARSPQKRLAEFDLVVTTYGLVRRLEWLAQIQWPLIVLDEAQAIKNPASSQARSVKRLAGEGRIMLTGTPVENHLGDLWSLFDFCCPGLLGTASQFKKFVKRLNGRQDPQAFGALRRLVRPYILRRLKTDPGIVPDLPEKTEMRTECGLSKKQAVLYGRLVTELTARLKQAEGIARRGLVLATLMQLKQICNHPSQYLGSGPYAPADSGKFERLQLLCEPIVERQERMLVFTQFQTLTQPLADFLATIFDRPGLVLHGGTPVRKRTELVAQFQESSGPPFFVVSLKAGGSGLNLTAASHVVHFDRWWNPAVENQATDRAFRIGQRRNVLVHKFVCRGTVEERIDGLIQSKQHVADQLLKQEGETLLTEMDDDQLLDFVALDMQRAGADE